MSKYCGSQKINREHLPILSLSVTTAEYLNTQITPSKALNSNNSMKASLL